MRLEVTLTSVDGTEKAATLYPEEISGIMGVILQMASGDPQAPVSLSITRKDLLKKFQKYLEKDVDRLEVTE